jgi:hypothetical protein
MKNNFRVILYKDCAYIKQTAQIFDLVLIAYVQLTEKMQAGYVRSRQTAFVRCCLRMRG